MNKKIRNRWLISLVLIIAASFYPLYMGAKVIFDMIGDGSVLAENYPKYLIPYTPVSAAVIFGTLLLPILVKYLKKAAYAVSAFLSVAVFLVTELLLERLVIITETVETTLESWQMFMCYVAPSSYTTKIYSAGEMLIGDYSPAFKLHFYIISVLLVAAILNCIYGYAQLDEGNKKRDTVLALQAISTFLFLALCILACFTAFWRTGELAVSPLSAILMTVFFIVFGLTSGILHASFAVGKGKLCSSVLPSVTSAITVVLMYLGELILLDGKLYRYGAGVFFEPMGRIAFSPCDIVIVISAFLLCYLILYLVERKKGGEK